MAIEFHCNHCGKLVRTSEEHAGKQGKCPACHQHVYIPTPPSKIEPLGLSPVDESAEREQARLEEESRRLAQRLASERERQPDADLPPAAFADDLLPPRTDMETLVIEYALCMAEGDLAGAEELAREIRQNMASAEEVMQRLTLDEIPPTQLAKIPAPVLVGFFKQLRERR
ncbi:MAG: hypothetical protein KKB50_03525 [Planctomycetes bacterium]|nr:hypothetical protein [Planctomycetota bacterium]